MRIGIDVSQVAYERTGVSEYLTNLVHNLIEVDKDNEYVLFFSSLRRRIQNSSIRLAQDKIQNYNSKVKIKSFPFPPVLLDLLWNRLHIFPIEWLIGKTDVFITSDWTEPPAKAKKATILYDLIVYKHPSETDSKIIETQKRKLKWVKKESDIIFCISESSKKDAREILQIPEKRLRVIYPGI